MSVQRRLSLQQAALLSPENVLDIARELRKGLAGGHKWPHSRVVFLGVWAAGSMQAHEGHGWKCRNLQAEGFPSTGAQVQG